jgi:hypothetical protein
MDIDEWVFNFVLTLFDSNIMKCRFFVPTAADSLLPIIKQYEADEKVEVLKLPHYMGSPCFSDHNEPEKMYNSATPLIMLIVLFCRYLKRQSCLEIGNQAQSKLIFKPVRMRKMSH